VQRDEGYGYFEVKKSNTQFNATPMIKQIVCTSTKEGEETLLNFEGVQ